MDKEMMERVVRVADYIILNRCTIRQAARKFGMGKSTVHKDIVYRLKKLDTVRYKEVRKVLENNLKERQIRGGESTRHVYIVRRYSKIA